MQLRRGDTRWGASGGERSVRRITNSIRPASTASLLPGGEAQTRGKGSPIRFANAAASCYRGDQRDSDFFDGAFMIITPATQYYLTLLICDLAVGVLPVGS